ncbi:MAG: CHAD domain-containing protein [Cyanothece sp. SIO1E1]|nr:CHAD domain-containing protein [Cyanothece sp. SIO1E1]
MTTQASTKPHKDRKRANEVKTAPLSGSIPSLGDCAYQAIQNHFKKSIKHQIDVLKDEDPEPLHQMRVGMRRLRTALQVFQPALDFPETIGDQQIAKIAKSLGKVRDLDVLQIWFQKYLDSSATKSESKQIKQVLSSLQQRRRKQFTQMKKTLKSSRYQTFVESFSSWLAQPAYQPLASLSLEVVLPDLLLPLISHLLLHPGWLVATQFQSGKLQPIPTMSFSALNQKLQQQGTILHDLRKQMKQVRYQTEFFVNFYDSVYTAQTKEFRTIQDLLGQLQDESVLSEFLEHELGTAWKQLIPSLDQYFQQECLSIWQQWQPIQQRYLDPDFRNTLRHRVMAPTLGNV